VPGIERVGCGRGIASKPWVIVTALAILVLAIPMAVVLGRDTYAAELERSADQARSRHAVEASVILVHAAAAAARQPQVTKRVGVRWSSAFEERVEFYWTVDPVTVGDTVTIWLDSTGQVTDPPATPVQVRGAAIGTGLAVWTARRWRPRSPWSRYACRSIVGATPRGTTSGGCSAPATAAGPTGTTETPAHSNRPA
jgi:hypothetical protein